MPSRDLVSSSQIFTTRSFFCAKTKGREKSLPFVLDHNGVLKNYLPVRANECTQPCIRALAF